MNPNNQGDDGCARNTGCLLMIVGVLLVILTPASGGITAPFGISLGFIGVNLFANGSRMASGQQGCRKSCLGCCVPCILVVLGVATIVYGCAIC